MYRPLAPSSAFHLRGPPRCACASTRTGPTRPAPTAQQGVAGRKRSLLHATVIRLLQRIAETCYSARCVLVMGGRLQVLQHRNSTIDSTFKVVLQTNCRITHIFVNFYNQTEPFELHNSHSQVKYCESTTKLVVIPYYFNHCFYLSTLVKRARANYLRGGRAC